MRSPLRDNHSGGAEPAPQTAARPDAMAKGRAAGPSLALGGLGVAAIATIIVFFGIGLSLLTAHPAQHLRLGSLSAVPKPSRPAQVSAGPSARREPPSDRGGARPAMRPALEQIPPTAVARKPSTAVSSASPPPPTAVASAGVRLATVAPVAAAGPEVSPPRLAANAAVSPPPPSSPRVAARASATAPLAAAQIAGLLAEGDAAFRRGDLSAARHSYRQAFDAGAGRGALGIGASYDPLFLRHFHLWEEHPDPDAAQAWYRRAHDLGAGEADGRLARLKAEQRDEGAPP